MHILHVFKTYYPDSFGGVERTIHALARGSAGLGIQSTILSLSRKPSLNTCVFHGHKAVKANLDFELASTSFSRGAFSKFADLSSRADLIHYHFPWPFMDVLHLCIHPRKPTIITYHSDIVKQKHLMFLYRPIMHRFFSSVDRIVATSDNYLKSSEVLQVYRGKTIVIPIGLDQGDYPAAPAEDLKRWGARFSRQFFLFVGVLRYYKGLHTLIEAAKHVDADIIIVGEGPEEAALIAHANQSQLDNIHFLGHLSDVDKGALLSLCTAFVFPSHLRSEAYGLSLVEAAMFGKPMISCEIGTGTSFINVHQHTGVVIPPEDPQALAAAMNSLVENPGTAKLYGLNALARYRKELTAHSMVQRYYQLYQSLLVSTVESIGS